MASPRPPASRKSFSILLGILLAFAACLFVVFVGEPSPTGPNSAPPPSESKERQHRSAGPASVGTGRPNSNRVVSGRVRTAEGEAIPFARVEFYSAAERDAEDEESADEDDKPLLSLETDEDGAFLAELSSRVLVIDVQAPGFARYDEQIEVTSEPLDIVLLKGATLVGRVVHAKTGNPVPRAKVAHSPHQERLIVAPVMTDDNGRFQIGDLPPFSYKPVATADGLYGVAARTIHLAPGQTSDELILLMHPVTILDARLVVQKTGEPCPRGSVQLIHDLMDSQSAQADEDGNVHFAAVPPGRYDYYLTCEGHARTETTGTPLLVEGASMTTTFEIKDAPSVASYANVRGVVVDENGDPVAISGLRVHGAPASNPQTVRCSTDIDDDGRFELGFDEFGSYVFMVNSALGNAKESVTVELLEGVPVEELKLVVRSIHEVRGKVVDKMGLPVAGAWVAADVDGNPEEVVSTDETGEFATVAFCAGRFDLAVSLDSEFELEPFARATIMVPTQNEIVIVLDAPNGQITGRVQGPPNPMERPLVQSRCDSSRQRLNAFSTVDGAGRFKIDRLPVDATCSIAFWQRDGAAARTDGVTVGQTVVLYPAPGATLRGKIAEPPLAFTVSYEAELGAGMERELFFGTNGEWEIRGVVAGKGWVRIRTLDGRVGHAEVAVRSGETRQVEIAVDEGDDWAGAP